ncbi:MAG: hypothetical protein ACKVQC_03055 [Elusimicrobiota bacterium]
MKNFPIKIFLTLFVILIPVTDIDSAAVTTSRKIFMKPSRFESPLETKTFEWGCPVSELVLAVSPAEAIQKISDECIKTAHVAANSKKGVFDVIKTAVIYPDVDVSQSENGYYLKGTFFLETMVLQTKDSQFEGEKQ